jgi:hypothetical protein
MSELTIQLPPELHARLATVAASNGQNVADYAVGVLAANVAASDLPRMPEGPQDLVELARQQGAPLSVRFEDLIGDFWPEDETCDEFIAAVREWRREGAVSQP